MKFLKAIWLFFALFVIPMLGCGTAGKFTQESDQWQGESQQWRRTVEDMMANIPELEKAAAQDIDAIVQNAVRAAGAETRCTADYVKNMVKAELDALLTYGYYRPVPVICYASPSSVHVMNGVASPDTIQLSGYNFDSVDQIRIQVISSTGIVQEAPINIIGNSDGSKSL